MECTVKGRGDSGGKKQEERRVKGKSYMYNIRQQMSLQLYRTDIVNRVRVCMCVCVCVCVCVCSLLAGSGPVDCAVGVHGRDGVLPDGLQPQGEVLPHHTQQTSQTVSKRLGNLRAQKVEQYLETNH